jgi:CBS domain-containing protein
MMATAPMVTEYMSRELLLVNPESGLAAAASVMSQRRIGSVLVVENGRLVGIFTERDIVRAVSQDVMAMHEAVSDWMTRDPLTVAPDTSVDVARELMLEHHFRHLPVTQGDELVGIISMRDLTRATVDEDRA